MNRLLCVILMMCLALSGAGCETTGGNGAAASNHREDQATRRTERDLEEANQKKTRKPMDTHRQDRQSIID